MNLSKHDPQTDMEMDMTPMIDVVFLLIIFFMIITDLTQQELEELELPIAVEAVEDKPDPALVRPIINIDYAGEIKIKRETYYDPESKDWKPLTRHLANQVALMKKGEDGLPENPLLVRSDRSTPFRQIQKVMEVCLNKDVRIWKIELAAAQPEAK